MKKVLTTFIGLLGITSGFCTQASINNEEFNEILPALKEIGREELASRFEYASNKLLEIIKDSPKVSNFIDQDKLKIDLENRKFTIQHNDIDYFKTHNSEKDNPLTKVPLPLLSTTNKVLIDVQEFVIWTHVLREALWFRPMSYDRNHPMLDFVPVQTLLTHRESIIDENSTRLILAGVEMDLRTASCTKGDTVPQNTHQLLDHFSNCQKKNYDPQQKVNDYQKYLTKEQNKLLTFQLLSIYLRTPSFYNCEPYMKILTKELIMNIDCRNLILAINHTHRDFTSVLNCFFKNNLSSCCMHYNNRIDNFIASVLQMNISSHILKKETSLLNHSIVELNMYLREPIRNKFRKLKNLKNDNSPIYIKFADTMCKGDCKLLNQFLGLFDLHRVCKFREIFNLPRTNK